MEPRARAILPVIGVLLVIIIALIAFFVTRRISSRSATPTPTAISEATPTATPSSRGLLLPTPTPTRGGTTTNKGLTQTPRTGVAAETDKIYSTALDDNGFRDTALSIPSGTVVKWLNLGTHAQELTIDGLSSGPIAAGATFAYQFDRSSTISSSNSDQSQRVTVQ